MCQPTVGPAAGKPEPQSVLPGPERMSTIDLHTARLAGLGERPQPNALLARQMADLRSAVARAKRQSRYYGEALRDFDADSLRSPEDLARLPFTLPADLARDPLPFLCVRPHEAARIVTVATSGTSGAAKRVFFTEADLRRTVDFFGQGMRELAEPGQTVAILLPGATESGVGRLLQESIVGIGARGVLCPRGGNCPETRETIRTAHCLVGMPADLLYLCRRDGGLRPATVLLSADYVPCSVVESLESAWRCRVFSHYGLTETGYGCAVQCRCRAGHHLRSAELFVEIVDIATGRPLGPGRRGEVVVTTLRREAMPLVRYRTGDLASWEEGPCGCGGLLPRLGRVEGRRENEIECTGGETLSIHRLDELLFALPEVRNFRACLRWGGRRDTLLLRVDASGPVDTGHLSRRLPAGLAVVVESAEIPPFAGNAKRCLEVLP